MNKTHKKSGKSTAKSFGLNAVLVNNDKVGVLTKGEDSYLKIEQTVGSDNVPTYYDPSSKDGQTFIVDASDPFDLNFRVVKEHNKKFTYPNPLPSMGKPLRGDLLGFKNKLEVEMFGSECPNDNVHIQLAYNVLDIKKILGLKINDIVFTLTNLQRDGEKDLIGTINPLVPWSSLDENKRIANRMYIDKLRSYALYFDNVFEWNDNRANENEADRNYNILRILSFLRQSCVHGSTFDASLFDASLSGKVNDLIQLSSSFLSKKIEEFNRNFRDNSYKNLEMLFAVLGAKSEDDKRFVSQMFYDYSLKHEEKNLGISLKLIRENIVEKFIKNKYGQEKQFIERRGTINKVLDFVLYDYYSNNKSHVQEIIKELVNCREEGKREEIYAREADFFATKNSNLIDSVKAVVDSNQKTKNQDMVSEQVRSIINSLEMMTGVNSISPFVQFVYVATKFLDAKEVNELATSLCNKVENMVSLYRAAEVLGIKKEWTKSYSLFSDANGGLIKLANELRLIKSFSSKKRKLSKLTKAKNAKKEDKIGRSLWMDALNIFLDDNFVTEFKEYPNGDQNARIIIGGKKKVQNPRFAEVTFATKARNLIRSMVINNRRFIYVIKFYDPKKCRKLIKNKNVLMFALTRPDMPMSILAKYYAAITKNDPRTNDESSRDSYAKALADHLQELTLQKIVDLGKEVFDEWERMNPGKMKTKTGVTTEMAKQLVTLYLTVLYVLVKGLVHVNSVYALAWSMFDRDYYYRLGKTYDDSADHLALLKDYMDSICPVVIYRNSPTREPLRYEGKIVYKNSRVRALLENNIQEAENFGSLYRDYRNKVEHNNAISLIADNIADIAKPHSYFDIFQFGIQRYLTSSIGEKNKAIAANYRSAKGGPNLLEKLNQFHCYQKDFLKVINLPFAYNMSRYKNLTIADLYNDEYHNGYQVKKSIDEWYGDK